MFQFLYLAATLQVASAQLPNIVVRDILVGQGPSAQTGQVATIQFEVRDKSGKELANTWKRGLPYSFVVGGIQTAPFWSLGLSGMKVGGQRMLDVKPGAGYGPEGVPPVVGPDCELIVRLELVEVKSVKPAASVK